MDANKIAGNIAAVRGRIAAAAERAGRTPGEVQLLAVTKTVPPVLIAAAANAGQKLFGENYVQPALEKYPALKAAHPGTACHLIGPLQRNKVKHAVGAFDVIQTVDRAALAQEISKTAAQQGVVQSVMIQVNISGEDSKSGILPAGARALAESILSLSALHLTGLMAIGTYYPPEAPDTVRRGEFIALRQLRGDLAAALGHELSELSMGMSDDFELAVEEGATIVRVGTAIFGERT